jgi:ribonuclease HII
MKALPNLEMEVILRDIGHLWVAGVDEVGRGPAAGPVTVAAVILPPDFQLDGVRDSKLIPEPERERLADEIKRQALAVGIGWSTNQQIDENGLTAALKQAGRLAVAQLGAVDAIILDGVHDYLTLACQTVCMPKADQTSQSVAAASIVAKVARDRYMRLLHRRYPAYRFDRHKGYLTAQHLQAIADHGLSPVHRRSWGRLRELA